jgi:hypothetical protein
MEEKGVRLKGQTVNRRPRTTQVRYNSEIGMWSACRKIEGSWYWLGEFATSTEAHEATHSAARLAECIERRIETLQRAK